MQNPVLSPAGGEWLGTRRLRAALKLLAGYCWLLSALVVFRFAAHFGGWHAETFRIDHLIELLFSHLLVAVGSSVVLFAAKPDRAVPLGLGNAALGILPLLILVSGDRVAAVSYPPVAMNPRTELFASHPRRLWALRQNAKSMNGQMETNQRGMRGPLVPLEKREGETRVLILGDSVAFGLDVKEEFTFDRLGCERAGVTCVNLSVPGYAPWQLLDVLRVDGLAYRPDVLVYGFCLNDVSDRFWHRIPRERPPAYRIRMLEYSGYFRLARGLWHDWRHFSTRDFSRERYNTDLLLENVDTPEVREMWAALLNDLGELFDFAAAQGLRAGILVFPPRQHLAMSADAVAPHHWVTDWAQARGIPTKDLRPHYIRACQQKGYTPRDVFLDDWHLSKLGHSLTIEPFIEFLGELQAERD